MRLHCENDDDDVDEDHNNNGLRSPKNLRYESVYFKQQRPSRTGGALVSTITSVYLFFTH